ncbi:hypothetical protein JKF63_04268 [Porcisia hertigi]|uniref:Uncharacterized protein n=1 Tax=Porcisia hertigi TaxID=2761500 RepID=A0A836L9R8_9TRYP|nr:hypothetical protein JKF63_04268 [Porcisia hertigi]
MRSRRQIVSDVVSVPGMDPWKDDRVRDFVAINTIQRLRAYHLPAGAPMPAVQEVNTARARNLILLPRADPDHRPCLGEQPPSRPQQRGASKQETQGCCQAEQDSLGDDDDENAQRARSPNPASVPPSPSSTSGNEGDINGDFVERRGSAVSVTATPSTQCAIDRARAVFFGASSFTSSTSPRRLVNSPHVMLTPSMASTTTTPFSSEARVAGRRRCGGEVGTGTTGDVWVTAVPPAASSSSAARSLGIELDAYIESNSTPLRHPPLMRHAGPSDEVTKRDSDVAPNNFAAAVAHEASKLETDGYRQSNPTKASETGTPFPLEEQPDSLETTPAAVRPLSPKPLDLEGNEATTPSHTHGCGGGGGGGGRSSSSCAADIVHTCDVCNAIIQYYQSMLTRGVVLDRYNHKDLAFVWWVLGCNMDVAALENRGPMRREALMITLRNFYYTLLSAEEAKTTAVAAAKSPTEGKELEGTGSAATVAPPSGRATVPRAVGVTDTGDGRGMAEDMEPHTKRASSKVVMNSTDAGDALAPADATSQLSRNCSRDSHTANASVASAAPSRHKGCSRRLGTGGSATAMKLDRADNYLVASNSDDECSVEDCGGIGGTEADDQHAFPPMTTRGGTAIPPPENASNRASTAPRLRRGAVACNLPGCSSSAATQDLAAALQMEDAEETATVASQEGVDDAVASGADVFHKPIESNVVSPVSSPTASRACSVSQSSSGDVRRRRRCAAERNKAVEETWVSTRTGRRAAAIKAAAQLELQGCPDSMAHRKLTDALPSAKKTQVSRMTAAKLPKGEASATATLKEMDTTLVSVTPSVPACGDTASKAQRKKNAASKRARSPSLSTYPAEGNGNQGSDTDADRDGERMTGGEERKSTEAPQIALQGHASKSKNRAAVTAKRPTPKSEKANISTLVTTPMELVAATISPPGTTTVPLTDPTTATTTPAKAAAAAAAAAAATASKRSDRGEEHRGRPRGGLKTPRIDATAPEEEGNSVLASVAQNSQRRRDGRVFSTAVLRGTSSETAAPDQRSDTAGRAVGVSPPSALAKAGEDATPCRFPVCRIPLHLSPNERAVRSRIQQRMGVLLATASPRSSSGTASHDTSPDPQRTTVYSSYTFLLSSFKTATGTHISSGGDAAVPRAITAPVLWYGQAPPIVVANESTSTSSSGAGSSRPERETAVAAPFREDALPDRDAPTLSTAIATAAVPTTRQRGRRRRIEGGIDPCLRGNILRHDQIALERRVNDRVAQQVECQQAAESRVTQSGEEACCAVASNMAQVKRERRSSSEEKEGPGEKTHVVATAAEVAGSGVDSPAPATGSSFGTEAHVSFRAATKAEKIATNTTAGEAFLPEQHHRNSAQRTPSPQALAFGDLPYAQQCLLVWSAAGLLEQHVRQLCVAETRRERLLARCGRMATRRMAARVAAVAQGSTTEGNTRGTAEDATAQLASELGGSDAARDSGASGEEEDLSGDEQTAANSRCPVRGRPSEVSRKADGRDHPHRPGHGGDHSTTSRSSSAASSSTSSEERFRSAMRPLPRRVYDYWAAYRGHGDNG